MCCGHEGYHGGFWSCGWPFRYGPRFRTKAEKIAWLELYLGSLQEEAGAVEERIAELREGK
jgi:hypothetical protein